MIDETETPHESKKLLSVYDAVLTFRKTIVTIKIRYVKIGGQKKEKLAFPENINENELRWKSYMGERVAVYHRIDENKYLNVEHTAVHTSLGQKLERLVLEAHEK